MALNSGFLNKWALKSLAGSPLVLTQYVLILRATGENRRCNYSSNACVWKSTPSLEHGGRQIFGWDLRKRFLLGGKHLSMFVWILSNGASS